MVQFTHEQFLGFIILSPFAAALLLICLIATKKIVGNIFQMVEGHLKFKKRMKGVEAMKARGEQHEWVKIAISLTREAHVCRKTGYCPDLYGFFEVSYIEKIEKERKQAEEYAKYREARIEQIGADYGISPGTMDRLLDEIISIPKHYHIMKLNQLQKELKAQTPNEF